MMGPSNTVRLGCHKPATAGNGPAWVLLMAKSSSWWASEGDLTQFMGDMLHDMKFMGDMLHNDTELITHVWHCLPELIQQAPSVRDIPNPHRCFTPPTAHNSLFEDEAATEP